MVVLNARTRCARSQGLDIHAMNMFVLRRTDKKARAVDVTRPADPSCPERRTRVQIGIVWTPDYATLSLLAIFAGMMAAALYTIREVFLRTISNPDLWAMLVVVFTIAMGAGTVGRRVPGRRPWPSRHACGSTALVHARCGRCGTAYAVRRLPRAMRAAWRPSSTRRRRRRYLPKATS